MRKVKTNVGGIVSKLDETSIEITTEQQKKITYPNLANITVSLYQVVLKGDVIGERDN